MAITTTNPDGDDVTFSLGTTNEPERFVMADEGKVKFKTTEIPNYSTPQSYTFNVIADGINQDVTLTINAVISNPVINLNGDSTLIVEKGSGDYSDVANATNDFELNLTAVAAITAPDGTTSVTTIATSDSKIIKKFIHNRLSCKPNNTWETLIKETLILCCFWDFG